MCLCVYFNRKEVFGCLLIFAENRDAGKCCTVNSALVCVKMLKYFNYVSDTGMCSHWDLDS